MELLSVLNNNPPIVVSNEKDENVANAGNVAANKTFIEANTLTVSLEEMNENHIIPVFIKDNEPVISHVDFIEAMYDATTQVYAQEQVLQPSIRVSHPIKGRIPEARNKPAIELSEHEKTLYYERMAFVIEIPTVYDEIAGNRLSLCIGGVKAYNLDNLYNRKGADEHFKIFIGFQNTVCLNLCIWSDGFVGNLKVQSIGQLKGCIKSMIEYYNPQMHLMQMALLENYKLTEKQFAAVVGKCRMYNHLAHNARHNIKQLPLGDSQVGLLCKNYYHDKSFSRDINGDINLWSLYNLLTGANKSSFIDNAIDRNVQAYQFAEGLRMSLCNKWPNWFLE